mmetsp:Transcript_124062/g.356210  ORF Transcript_124062/g.356210 Transcript_124062/m.356210 type:complete len:215 (-) Transcript_124062:462-1106(-)
MTRHTAYTDSSKSGDLSSQDNRWQLARIVRLSSPASTGKSAVSSNVPSRHGPTPPATPGRKTTTASTSFDRVKWSTTFTCLSTPWLSGRPSGNGKHSRCEDFGESGGRCNGASAAAPAPRSPAQPGLGVRVGVREAGGRHTDSCHNAAIVSTTTCFGNLGLTASSMTASVELKLFAFGPCFGGPEHTEAFALLNGVASSSSVSKHGRPRTFRNP